MRWLYAVATSAALLACADARVDDPLHVALELVPAELSPGPIALRIATGRTRIHAEPERGELVVSSDLVDADQSVWLHELAHFGVHGPRPTSSVGRRLASAIEEGVADYFAATLRGSTRVGDSRIGIRDLAHPPRISAESWASLGLSGFDSHHFGWAFAAELWKAEPGSRALLTDLVAVLSGDAFADSESPRAIFAALVAACPERSRARLGAAVRAWAPEELHGFNNEESP